MSRQNVLTRTFPSAKCQHCGEITNIGFSSCFRQMVAKNKTLSELIKMKDGNIHKWLNIKNGQIQAMHKSIAQFIGLLDDKQKEKAKLISQELRDLIKKVEKEGCVKNVV